MTYNIPNDIAIDYPNELELSTMNCNNTKEVNLTLASKLNQAQEELRKTKTALFQAQKELKGYKKATEHFETLELERAKERFETEKQQRIVNEVNLLQDKINKFFQDD